MSATNRGSIRNPNDLYETPDYSVDSLLEVLDLNKVNSFLEPCKASGRIYNKLNLFDKDYCEIDEGRNYLTTIFPKKSKDLIITNPPFSLAQEFLEKSLQEANSVWYLLRLNFLGSKKRVEFWQKNLPTHLLVLSKRPSFAGNGTDATDYAWFGWDTSSICKLPPGIHVLDYKSY